MQGFITIGRLFLVAVLIYIGAWVFGYLPPKFTPPTLYEQAMELYNKHFPKSKEASKEAELKPIDKATKATQDYENRINKQKEILDDL